MKVSSRIQYGLQILCYLALRYGGEPIQSTELAAVTGTTEKYIGQIMLVLRASPLVSAARGSQGGYYLSRSPAEITVLQALAALDGELLQFEPLSGEKTLDALSGSLRALHTLMEQSLVQALEHRSLEDLAREGQHDAGIGDWTI